MEIKETELLIIGGGLAGLIAAYTAFKSGIKDISLIYEGKGASTDIFGINILGLNRIEAKGDSCDIFLNDTIKSSCGINDSNLTSFFIKKTREIKDIIAETGLDVMDEDLFSLVRPLGSSYSRCAFYNDRKSIGVVLMAYFGKKIEEGRGNIINNISVTHLLEKENRVMGAYGYDIKRLLPVTIKAKAVILASGGFSNIYSFTTTFPTINGSCHISAYNAGAELTDLEFVQFEPCVCVYPDTIKGLSITTTMLNDGAKLYNKDRKPFIEGEYPNKNILSLAMYREIMEGRATENGGLYFNATILDDRFIEKAYPSFITKYKKGGIDIRKDMLEVAPAAHYSCGGIKIDNDCATKLKGLYACGEITGGIHGANRLGGNAGAETLVFGKIAGKNAVNYINNSDIHTKDNTILDGVKKIEKTLGNTASRNTSYEHIKKEVKKIVYDSANVIRDGISLKKGISKLELLKEEALSCISEKGSEEDKYNYFSTDSIIEIGRLLLMSADLRKESRGNHYRSDYPERNDKDYLKNIIVKKTDDGPQLSLREVG